MDGTTEQFSASLRKGAPSCDSSKTNMDVMGLDISEIAHWSPGSSRRLLHNKLEWLALYLRPL